MKRTPIVLTVTLIMAVLLLGRAVAFTADAANPNQNGTKIDRARQALVSSSVVSSALKSDTSPKLRDIPPQAAKPIQSDNENDRIPGRRDSSSVKDSVRQSSLLAPFAMPTPIVTWDGMYNQYGPIPPDTNGDVGRTQYVQLVNSGIQVFNKNTGASEFGPVNFNTIWYAFGGVCETYNNGDPVVLYDSQADRWMVSQFAFASQAGPTYQCIAVSTGPDAAGSYYRYAFQSTAVGFDDYPHYGVMPDAYYMTANRFGGPNGFAGANIAYERPRMLVGDPTARLVQFEVVGDGGALPADLDGLIAPPAGNPEYFWYPTDPATGLINEYKFHVDWTNPVLSTFLGPFPILVAPWNDSICSASRGACIPQPGTTAQLESIADRFMFRLAYRNYGTHEALTTNHTVNATGTNPGIAGIRWYEVRDPNGLRTVQQQGTYAPSDNVYRWMGSMAMDRMGDMAVGFSASSSTLFPSIRYAGRLVSDPPNQLAQGEATLHAGGGSEDFPAAPRWGDYSALTVDPVDDCTFYFTTEYFAQTGLRNWRTRIGSFRFPSCVAANATATPVPTESPCPIQFSDVDQNNTFYAAIHCLACKGIVSGYSDGTFRPNNQVTRGQLAKMVSNSAGFNEPITGQTFQDVPPSNPFYVWIERLTRRGYMTGYVCGGPGEPCVNNRPYFRPFANATRGQTAKIVANAAGFNEPPVGQTFEDVPASNIFYQYIQRLATRNVMQGYPCGGPGEPCITGRPYFRPNNDVTRGQSAKIVANAFFPGCTGDPTPVPTSTSVPPVPTETRVPVTPLPATATPCAGGVSYTGSITNSDATQNGRLGVGSPPSSCAAPRPVPAFSDQLVRHYDEYSYTNSTGSPQCVTVSITQACGDNAVQSIAYLGTFVPTAIQTNYLAHGGAAGPSYQYSFSLSAGQTAKVIMLEVSPNLGCTTYSLTISACVTAVQPTATVTATAQATPCVPTYTAATATATMIAGGTDIGNHCDDCDTAITLPFPVTFYNRSYTTANVSSNGDLQFASNNPNIYTTHCIPVVGATPPFASTIFAYYGDLRTDELTACPTCGIFTQTIGTAPNRQFVIRWHTTYFDFAGEAEFEVVLTEGSVVPSVIYGPSQDSGATASAGTQFDDTRATQYSCNTAVLTNGLRINYTPTGCLQR